MFVAVTVVFAVLVTNCGSLSETEFSEIAGACGYSPSNPFTDRDDARHNEFPWSAQLFFTFGEGYRQNIYCEPTLTNVSRVDDIPEKSHSFGEGSLISPNFVLTTAQCLILPPLLDVPATLSYVRLGKWNIDSPDIIDVPVAKFIAHTQYDLATQQNDIGLVKLQSNIVYTDSIRPICLPLWGKTIDENEHLIQTGWGETENEKCSHQKRKSQVYITPPQNCTSIFENVLEIHDGHICAGGRIPYDTCSGNIGAPLMSLEDSTNQWTQIGLMTRRERCDLIGIPAIYTKVSWHINWILANMESRNIILA